ncbi:hypothetical protein [Streptomyces sp. NPDC101455]|uniref:hypothetical protein n=1 Tax=Streptomyces sp. NPDC101455 TaxID=3366142 RepID=UPI0037FB7E44
MTDSKQETERKYDAPSADDATWVPDLTGVGGIASVVDQGTQDLDAVYYDTVPRGCHRARWYCRAYAGLPDP